MRYTNRCLPYLTLREEIIGLFSPVLCTRIVLNYMHTLIWAVLTGELGPVGWGLVSCCMFLTGSFFAIGSVILRFCGLLVLVLYCSPTIHWLVFQLLQLEIICRWSDKVTEWKVVLCVLMYRCLMDWMNNSHGLLAIICITIIDPRVVQMPDVLWTLHQKLGSHLLYNLCAPVTAFINHSYTPAFLKACL